MRSQCWSGRLLAPNFRYYLSRPNRWSKLRSGHPALTGLFSPRCCCLLQHYNLKLQLTCRSCVDRKTLGQGNDNSVISRLDLFLCAIHSQVAICVYQSTCAIEHFPLHLVLFPSRVCVRLVASRRFTYLLPRTSLSPRLSYVNRFLPLRHLL